MKKWYVCRQTLSVCCLQGSGLGAKVRKMALQTPCKEMCVVTITGGSLIHGLTVEGSEGFQASMWGVRNRLFKEIEVEMQWHIGLDQLESVPL